MKMAISVLTSILLLGGHAIAGASDYRIDCKSSSGRTTLAGWLPGDSLGYNVDFTVDGKTDNYRSVYRYDEGHSYVDENAYLAVVSTVFTNAPVFTLVFLDIKEHRETLSLYMVPGTLKVIKDHRHDRKASFKARVYGKDPRKATGLNDYLDSEIEMTCEYSYSI